MVGQDLQVDMEKLLMGQGVMVVVEPLQFTDSSGKNAMGQSHPEC